MTLKAQSTKEKIDKLDFMKIKNFCVSKHSISRVKRQPIKCEIVFTNHLSDTGLISRIYRELLKLNIKKQLNSKIDKGLEQTFLQRYTNGQ